MAINKIKSFTFYDNYYKLLKLLSEDDKKIISLAILEYIFEDKEPTQLNDNCSYIWENIVMPLNTSKKQALNVGKRWEEKNTKEDTKPNTKKGTKKNTKSDTKKDTNNNFLFLISNLIKEGLLREKVESWLKYKIERNEPYKETGFKTLLTRIQNNANEYGEKTMIELIEDSMANNYKGIIFDKLKKQVKRKEPEWVGKEIKEEYLTDEQVEIMEKLMRGEKVTEEERKILDGGK